MMDSPLLDAILGSEWAPYSPQRAGPSATLRSGDAVFCARLAPTSSRAFERVVRLAWMLAKIGFLLAIGLLFLCAFTVPCWSACCGCEDGGGGGSGGGPTSYGRW